MKYTQTLLLMAVMQASYGWAGAGHDHHHSAETPTSATDSRPWRLDVQLGYQDVADPVIPGFLNWNGHSRDAGFRLQHLDVGRSFALPSYNVNGKINLSVHQTEVEIHEAWVRHRLSNELDWQIGQVLVDIGQLNARHTHDHTYLDWPLYQRALWGGEMSEATARLAWHQESETRAWRWSSAVSLLSTEQQQTEKASGAGLLNLAIQYQTGGIQARLKVDVYQARINQRGLNLFSFSSSGHSHDTGATEYFDGVMRHQAVALITSWHSRVGILTLEAEHQQRTETGALYSADGQVTDVSADAELASWGGYASLSWRLPESVVPLELALRQQWLGSDVVLMRPATTDLASSVLNQNGEQPEGSSYLLRWHIGHSSLSVQRNQWHQASQGLPEWIIGWRYGVSF